MTRVNDSTSQDVIHAQLHNTSQAVEADHEARLNGFGTRIGKLEASRKEGPKGDKGDRGDRGQDGTDGAAGADGLDGRINAIVDSAGHDRTAGTVKFTGDFSVTKDGDVATVDYKGHAVPSGGATGQALVKASADSYDLKWGTVSSGAAVSVGRTTFSDRPPKADEGTDGDAWFVQTVPMQWYSKSGGVWKGGYTQQGPDAAAVNIGLGTTVAVGTSNYPVDLRTTTPVLWSSPYVAGSSVIQAMRFPFGTAPAGSIVAVKGPQDGYATGDTQVAAIAPGSAAGLTLGATSQNGQQPIGLGNGVVCVAGSSGNVTRSLPNGEAATAAFGATPLKSYRVAAGDTGRCWAALSTPVNTAASGSYLWESIAYKNLGSTPSGQWTVKDFNLAAALGVTNTAVSATNIAVSAIYVGYGYVWVVASAGSSGLRALVKADDTTSDFQVAGSVPSSAFNGGPTSGSLDPDNGNLVVVSAVSGPDTARPGVQAVTLTIFKADAGPAKSVIGVTPSSFDAGGFPNTLNVKLAACALGGGRYVVGGVVWSSQLDKSITTVGSGNDCRRPVIWVVDLSDPTARSTMIFDGTGYTAAPMNNSSAVTTSSNQSAALRDLCSVASITRTGSGKFAALVQNGSGTTGTGQTNLLPWTRATLIGLSL